MLTTMLTAYPPIECNDGFTFSVQASSVWHCTPCNDEGPYTHVEVGFPNASEPLLDAYFDNSKFIYINVPSATVLAVIEKHGGIRSGELPPLSV